MRCTCGVYSLSDINSRMAVPMPPFRMPSSMVMMRENELGTLETGKLADIIIAQGNPLEDLWLVSKADNIKIVMQDGKIKKNMMKGICCV